MNIIIERALDSTDLRLSFVRDLREGCKDLRGRYDEADSQVLEYLTEMTYHDWGLARYILNRRDVPAYDVIEEDLARLTATGYDSDESAFWDLIEHYLQEIVD